MRIPQELIDVLQHIIISHHGVPEFGAVKLPATPEAIAVHMIENMDAKLTMSLAATRGEQNPGVEGNWTEYMKAMGTRMYRPDVARSDLGTQEVADPVAPSPAAAKAPPTLKVSISNPLFESGADRRK